MPSRRASDWRLHMATYAKPLQVRVSQRAAARGSKTRMDKFKIQGGRRLEGSVQISGAKNAALPIMAAALLTSEKVHLDNIPRVRDIITMAKLLAHMKVHVVAEDLPPSAMTIQTEEISHAEAPYELVKTMRASVLTLGPLVARFGTRACRCPEAARLGRGRLICTSRRLKRWARRLQSIMAMWKQEPNGCAGRKSISRKSP